MSTNADFVVMTAQRRDQVATLCQEVGAASAAQYSVCGSSELTWTSTAAVVVLMVGLLAIARGWRR